MRLIAPGLVVVLITIFLLPASAQETELLSRSYTPDINSTTIKTVLDNIEEVTDISISYSNSSVNTSDKAVLSGKENTIGGVLTSMFANKNIDIITRKNKILLISADKNSKLLKSHKITINGYVKEDGSMETLIGATIIIPSLNTGTVTNTYGYYSLTIPDGSYIIVCSYIGYRTDTIAITLKDDTRKDLFLKLQNKLAEVKVAASKQTPGGHVHLNYADIKERPALLGETDVMRAIQNIAGVSSATEGSNKVLVRGGDPGQNLNLIDGVPLYYVDHFFGLTSVFNTEAIKSVDFYKGAFPARYGGRLSSVIDINTKDGDMEKWGGQFSLGLIKGSFNIDGPIIKDKSSIMVSFRRTWLDALWRFGKTELNNTKIDFYDFNAKANYILDKNNRLYLSVYNGRDQIGINPGTGYFYTTRGNTLGSVKWNSIISPKLFLNTMVTYSYFRFSLKMNEDFKTPDSTGNTVENKGISTINDIALNSHATWYPNASHRVETGIHYSNAYFVPVSLETKLSQYSFSIKHFPEHFYSNEVTFYAEDEIKPGGRWTFRPGLHFSNWFSKKFNYSSLQPRLYTSYKLADRHIIYASFTEMAQFLHLINNNQVGLPSDFWIPSSSSIEPEESYMGSLGYEGVIGKNKSFNYNLEFYYKDIRNVTTYSMGKDLFANAKSWEENIIQGKGWSYGSEVSLNEKIGSFKFRLAYTLSWTWRQFAALNDGVAFPYRYDRRHNLKVAAIYRPSQRFELSANWTYMSGEAITLPDQVYPDLSNNLMVSQNNSYFASSYTYNYVKWNNYRLPALHRLDLAANFSKIKGKHLERIWSIGVYNAYARPNVMVVSLDNDLGINGSFKLTGFSLLQFIPFVNYQLKF